MSEVKVIGIGNDHAAVDLKNEIKAYLEEKGYKVGKLWNRFFRKV